MTSSSSPPSSTSSSSICRYFASTGNCYYGDQCNFSHVAPGGTGSGQASANSSAAQSLLPKSQRACRNIAIHGFCKFQGKGCEYNHDLPSLKPTPAADGASGVGAVIVGTAGMSLKPGPEHSQAAPAAPTQASAAAEAARPGLPQAGSLPQSFVPRAQAYPADPSAFLLAQPPQTQLHFNPAGGSLPHVARPASPLPAGRRPLQSFFMSETLRQDLLKRNLLIISRVEDGDARYKDVPPAIGRYHSLLPLEEPLLRSQASKVFLYPTQIFKGINSVDGLPYALRRVEGFRTSEFVKATSDLWMQVRHPSVVALREVFISKDFIGEPSLIFAYDYHPASVTLETKHFAAAAPSLLPEPVLWSFISQLLAGLKAIHSAGLACRVVHPSKITVTGKNRVRINGVGLLDALQPDPKPMAQQQAEDVLSLGKLILALASKTPSTVHNVPKLIETVGATYSVELKNLLIILLRQPMTVDEVTTLVAARALQETEHLHSYTDLLEADLAKELENGRLLRLLVKLGFINERPEFELDPSWSETGDRYLLKLFRDYVFHQVYEDGAPVIDWGHVIECLNKLDVGVPEKIMLMSRDEQSIIVVSYADLKRCIEGAFGELQKAASAPKTV